METEDALGRLVQSPARKIPLCIGRVDWENLRWMLQALEVCGRGCFCEQKQPVVKAKDSEADFPRGLKLHPLGAHT